MVIEYISDLKKVYPSVEGRILFVEDDSTEDCVRNDKIHEGNSSARIHTVWLYFISALLFSFTFTNI